MTFKGKTILITGAASGIGRATARRFAAEGARVAVVDRDVDEPRNREAGEPWARTEQKGRTLRVQISAAFTPG